MNNNSPPLTFKRFQTIVSRLELPRRPLPPITQQQMDKCHTKIGDNHDQLYSIPSLEELGMHNLCFHVKFFYNIYVFNLILRKIINGLHTTQLYFPYLLNLKLTH